MRPLFAALVLVSTAACSQESGAGPKSPHEPKWIEYGIAADPTTTAPENVQAFSELIGHLQRKAPVKVELPLQRARVESAKRNVDQTGGPGAILRLDKRDAAQSEVLTAEHLDHELVVTVEGKVVSIGWIKDKLPGEFELAGRYTDNDLDQILKALE